MGGTNGLASPNWLPSVSRAWMRVSATLSTHVGTALGNEFQIGVRLERRPQLHLREPIHTRIHLVVRDDQHRKGKCAHKREKGPRGPFHSLSSSLLLNRFGELVGVAAARLQEF